MKLSEVPFNELKIDDKVKFLYETGKITALTPKHERVQENQLAIFWEERNVSILYHSWCGEIEYIG